MSTAVETAFEIRPFQFDVPYKELDDLRRRIEATRFVGEETVGDQSQGVQSATIQELARYWATEYDWRKCEARQIIEPLTHPTAQGRRRGRVPSCHPVDARLRVLGKPQDTGWNTDRIARCVGHVDEAPGLHAVRVAGSDWGARVSEALAHLAPEGCWAST
ncbi:MAG TPA: epoxide hydrolase N-terminal domain-containing protein [Candidatus Dormibacteraeota bacterium]|nr:epoxide hydrolase N-terminal domain-containing protein [Candidatus Dormibacteraeota bacterium]